MDFTKNSNLIIFLVDFNCSSLLIFSEKSGNSETSNKDNVTVIPINNSIENLVL